MQEATREPKLNQDTPPELSLIIPAYNEEAELPRTLAAVREALAELPCRAEIIVVDNNSTDRTADIAREGGARVVFEAHNQIARARNAGAAAARGRYLQFVDADTRVHAQVLQASLEALRAGCIGGGTILRFETAVDLYARLVLRCWLFLSQRLRLAAGSYLFCPRDVFERVGGFDENLYAGEEISLSQRLKKAGRSKRRPFVILAHSIETSARKLDWHSPLSLFGQMLFLLVMPLALRSRRFCSFWYKRPSVAN